MKNNRRHCTAHPCNPWITRFMRVMTFFSIFVLLYAQSSSHQASANEFGLAMHGQAKYASDAKALDYTDPNAEKGGHLKQSATGTFDTLNPYSLKGKAAQGLNLFYGRLMTRVWDEPFTLYPSIAERYETDAERSFITFHIDPDARFNDGSPVTARDIVFSFETLREKGRPNMRKVYKLVKNVEILCDEIVFFEFDDGYDRETALILAMMPVLSEKWWESRDFDNSTLETPLSNGPYTIESVDPGRSITYKRNSDFWAADQFPNASQYNFDRMTYEYYRDDSVALESFLSGDLNLRREWDIAKWESAYASPALDQGRFMKQEFKHGRPERTKGFIFNTRRPPFDDPKIREALSLTLDKDWLIEKFFYGKYKPITSYFPNSEFAYTSQTNTDGAQSFRHRLKSAKDLLSKAGWSIENGILQKDGSPFSFELLLHDPEEEKIALHLQKNLKRLGIDMRIRVLDQAAFRGRLQNYDYDMVSYFWQSSLSPGTEQVIYWGCEAGKTQGGFNYPGICDQNIDTLARDVAFTKNRQDLVKTMQALDKELQNGHYMIPLFYKGGDYIAHDKAIQSPEKTPIYGPVIESWWMDSQE